MLRTGRSAALLFALALASGAACTTRPDPVPKTVILISIDTLRADGLSCYGNRRGTSPAIDALAADGIRFENVTAPSPWTIPSHAAMLTSLMPTVIGATAERPVPEAILTLGEHLQRHGFATGAVVNNVYMSERYHFDQGFDDFVFMEHEKRGGAIVNRALHFLDRRASEPVFLFMHFMDVHAPYTPRPPHDSLYADEVFEEDGNVPWLRQVGYHQHLPDLEDVPSVAYLRARYDAGVAAVDTHVGRFLQALDARGRYEDALVILTSDHGEAFFERGIWVGHGLFLFENELRIPLILKLPGGERRGTSPTATVGLLDVAPTITRSLGLPGLPDAQGKGLLVRADAVDDAGPRDPLFGASSNIGDTHFVREGQWKYVEPMITPLDRVLTEHLRPNLPARRYLERRVPVSAQLYDLTEDPGEARNLAEARPEVAARLAEGIRQRRQADQALRNQLLPAALDGVELTPEEIERLRSLGYAH